MFKKILVALDLSEMSEQVLGAALMMAQATQADLMLLHILSPDEEDSPKLADFSSLGYYPFADGQILDTYQEQWKAFEQKGLAQLRRWTDQAMELGLNAEFSQNYGKLGSTICDLARTWEADLIMVGRRGRAGLKEFMLGSVSNYVLHHAPCAVLVVHRNTPGVMIPSHAHAAQISA